MSFGVSRMALRDILLRGEHSQAICRYGWSFALAMGDFGGSDSMASMVGPPGYPSTRPRSVLDRSIPLIMAMVDIAAEEVIH